MTESAIIDSSFTALIKAPIDKIDIPAWVFSLPEAEYQACSSAHVSAATTKAADGRRMCINVEVIGGSLMVQHFVEEISEKHHLVLTSTSDVFTPTGRTTINVTWELRAKPIDASTCEFTNRVHTSPTDDLTNFLARQGIPFEQFRAMRSPASEAHNRAETPFFAASIEHAALRH